MYNAVYAINEGHIRNNGQRLAKLALLGEVVILIGAGLSVIFWAYALTRKIDLPDTLQLVATTHLIVQGEVASNLWAMTRVATVLAMLECIRRLGHGLNSPQPLGPATLRWLSALRSATIVLVILFCTNMDIGPAPDFRITLDLSLHLLYFGALFLLGISTVQRFARQMVLLKTETDGFI